MKFSFLSFKQILRVVFASVCFLLFFTFSKCFLGMRVGAVGHRWTGVLSATLAHTSLKKAAGSVAGAYAPSSSSHRTPVCIGVGRFVYPLASPHQT